MRRLTLLLIVSTLLLVACGQQPLTHIEIRNARTGQPVQAYIWANGQRVGTEVAELELTLEGNGAWVKVMTHGYFPRGQQVVSGERAVIVLQPR